MDKKTLLASLNENAGPSQARPAGMSRRDWVRRLATAMTAGTALSAVADQAPAHPVYRHLMNEATMEQADSKASETAWKPLFLDPHQSQTFTILAERIVPGSNEAQVTQFVDLLLSVDTQDNQKQFLNSLSAFEAYSLTTYQQPFKNLSEDQQTHVLTVASTMEPGQQPQHRRARRHTPGPASQPAGGQSALTLRDHFENLKHWVSGAYFSSEPGMKYMGWTGQMYFASFPGCQKSGSRA